MINTFLSFFCLFLFEHNFNTIDPYKRKPNEWLITTPRNYASHDSAHYIQQGAIEFLCSKSVKCISHDDPAIIIITKNSLVIFTIEVFDGSFFVCVLLRTLQMFVYTAQYIHFWHFSLGREYILCVRVWLMQARINLNFVCFFLRWLACRWYIYKCVSLCKYQNSWIAS